MRPVIALLILGSIVTSASAAGTEMHGIAEPPSTTESTTVDPEQQHHSRYRELTAVPPASVVGNRRSSWNILNSSNPV